MAHIAKVSTKVLQPGTEFVIEGSGLEGQVLLAIPGSPIVVLRVLDQIFAGSQGTGSTVVSVTVKVPDDLSGLPSSNEASIFVAGSSGNSNEVAVIFNAAILYFLCHLSDDQAGGLFGAKKNAVAGGGSLAPHQALETVVLRRMDGGNAFLQDPTASGDDLRQGYHIGTPAAQGTRIRLYYEVQAPRGFEPSPIPGFTAWDASDIPWLIPDNF